jgi:predicted ester cyclase
MQRNPSCHLGEYQGKAPTGIQVRLQGKSEVCIYQGKIVKQWREMDEQTLEQQLEQPKSS